MSAFDEMDAYIHSPPFVNSTCWLGQLTLGTLTSLISSWFAALTFGRNTFPQLLSACIGAATGVFASSSGGGPPHLFTSGGGLPGYLFILSASTAAVAAGRLAAGCETSLIPDALLAGGVGSVAAGFAANAALKVSDRPLVPARAARV